MDLAIVLAVMEPAQHGPAGQPLQVPVFGVNVGHLGFLTEVETDGLMPALDRLLAGDYTLEERMLISAAVSVKAGKSPGI